MSISIRNEELIGIKDGFHPSLGILHPFGAGEMIAYILSGLIPEICDSTGSSMMGCTHLWDYYTPSGLESLTFSDTFNS